MTYEEVITEHQKIVGAGRISFTLGPESTPEGVREELNKLRIIQNAYDEFSDLEKEKAKVARLKRQLSKICKLSKTSIHDFASQTKEVSKLKSEIFNLSDYFIDVDLDADMKWMELKRKNGKVTPKETKEIFK